jgi:Cof subfamily protein (haloacid dehalogenase superfamily)
MPDQSATPRNDPASRVRLVVSDVDGTLVTHDKRLTQGTIDAVKRLREAGVAFVAVSSRPPRGMTMLVEPLKLELFAGFNGGMIVRPDLTPVEQHLVPPGAARKAAATIAERGIDLWVFADNDWLVTNPGGHYVPLERQTVQFEPTVVEQFGDHLDRAGKLVASSDDFDRLARTEAELQELLGSTASAKRSQLYYIDVTNPVADKGYAARSIARHFGVPIEEVAVLGDMANDLPMFAVAGLAIAMGNALPPVQEQAHFVTASNEEDGVAKAIETIILPRAAR